MNNWAENIYDHLLKLQQITDDYSNPLKNDAGGSIDCERLKNDIDKWIKYWIIHYDHVINKYST